MWTVSKEEVADLLTLDVMARLRDAEEKTALFEQTYEQPFEDFEQEEFLTTMHGPEVV